MAYAVRTQLIHAYGALTRKGKSQLRVLKEEHNLLAALIEVQANAANLSLMDVAQRRAFVQSVSKSSGAKAKEFRPYLLDPTGLQQRMDEMQLKWQN